MNVVSGTNRTAAHLLRGDAAALRKKAHNLIGQAADLTRIAEDLEHVAGLLTSAVVTVRPRGVCSVCDDDVALRSDGTVRAHGPRMLTRAATTHVRCGGSHQPPKEAPAP